MKRPMANEKEKTLGQRLEEELCYKSEAVLRGRPELADEALAFCEGYKQFLDEGKTERECAHAAARLLAAAGYRPYEAGVRYAPGDKVFFVNRFKSVVAATIGRLPLDKGLHMNISHIDSPRLDLKPLPLYEADDLALLKTHYYGGLRKYQWTALPLSLHGVVCRADGSKAEIRLGDDPADPVFCITDLLPHLSADQNDRKLRDGVKGEELNILVGHRPVEDPEVKERVKLQVLKLLHEQYGVTEKDFIRAELEAVPAFGARDVGLDRMLLGAYGQDDRVDAYTALMAEIETKAPAFTTLCVLTDKEEIGSEGVTGMNSLYVFQFIEQLCQAQGADSIRALQNSVCLSADVTAAVDPTFDSVFERRNSTFAGRGVAVCKYTGARGKSSASDASAELVGYLTALLDEAGVAWQTGELGKVDQGGGGTIAAYAAYHNVDTIDIGVPVLSMHAPFEVTSKLDVYMAYKAFLAFAQAEK